MYSYKLKDFGYNVIVCYSIKKFVNIKLVMLTNGWWIWCGTPVEASTTNDYGLAKSEVEELKKLFDKRDLLICDRAFRPLREELQLVCRWIKLKGKTLEAW